jgi:GNAT superfamily N-acetyltransferase
MMPHNPPRYVHLVEGAGFVPARNLLAYKVGNPDVYDPVPERFDRAAALVKKRTGATLRPLDMKRFREDVEQVKVLYNAAWEDNWGFVPMTEAEIDLMARQFRPVVVPEMVPFVEIDGEPIGFGLVMPDLNEVLRHNRNGRLVPGAIRILWALKRRKLRRIRILALGVLPEYRNKGIDVLLYHWIWTRGEKYGYTWAEAGWVLEDNPSMNKALERLTFDPYKKYRLYDREL